jgi:hypothetical protein
MKVRVLKFKKCFQGQEHTESDWWAVLGHMDEMESTLLENTTLQTICRHNNDTYKEDSDKIYHHLIYLIDNDANVNGQQPDANLWATGDADNADNAGNADFLAVTRIHFSKPENLLDQYNKLNQVFQSLASGYPEVSYRTYLTLELSDMILVSRSSKFQTLAKWALTAPNHEIVGSSYTYFCIPGGWIHPGSKGSYQAEDRIDFLAMRFSVKKKPEIEALLQIREKLGKNNMDAPFWITGNEDAILCGKNVPVENLIELYSSWYNRENGKNIFDVFCEIITRIGISLPQKNTLGYFIMGTEEPLPPSDSSSSEVGNLEYHSMALQELVQSKVDELDSVDNKEWLRPMVELTNALVHMSRSATLDETTFLILPGLFAFWRNVVENPDPSMSEKIYLDFAELCIHTMEHLMRAEGQLSQRPEVRPLTYDIPVFMLEYATTFLLMISEILTGTDDGVKKNIDFLLVPCAEMDVSAVELFEATDKTPGLLQITVPFSFLYKPRQLLPALCHELAHYVGESCRMRDRRYKLFLHCTAREMIKYFFGQATGDLGKFQAYIATNFLAVTLQESVNNLNRKADQLTLSELVSRICGIAEELTKQDAYADFAREYINSGVQSVQFYALPEFTLLERLPHFCDRMCDLSISFRETYADICMLYLLQISINEYLDVVLLRTKKVNASTLLRIYISLSVSGETIEDIRQALEKYEGLKYTEDIDGVEDVDDINEDDPRLKIREALDTIYTLANKKYKSEYYLNQYIQQCWNKLKKRCTLPNETGEKVFSPKQIYSMILELNSTTSYQDILEVIDHGRQMILKQLDDKQSNP